MKVSPTAMLTFVVFTVVVVAAVAAENHFRFGEQVFAT